MLICPKCGNRLTKTQGEQTATSASYKEMGWGEPGKRMNWFERDLKYTVLPSFEPLQCLCG